MNVNNDQLAVPFAKLARGVVGKEGGGGQIANFGKKPYYYKNDLKTHTPPPHPFHKTFIISSLVYFIQPPTYNKGDPDLSSHHEMCRQAQVLTFLTIFSPPLTP